MSTQLKVLFRGLSHIRLAWIGKSPQDAGATRSGRAGRGVLGCHMTARGRSHVGAQNRSRWQGSVLCLLLVLRRCATCRFVAENMP